MADMKLEDFDGRRAAKANAARRERITEAARKAATKNRMRAARKSNVRVDNWLKTQPWYVNAGPLATRSIDMTQEHGASRYVRRFNPTLPAIAGTVTPWKTVLENLPRKDATL
jgi:hypothetical protein